MVRTYNKEFVPAAGVVFVLVLALPKRFNGAGLFADEANISKLLWSIWLDDDGVVFPQAELNRRESLRIAIRQSLLLHQQKFTGKRVTD